MGRRAKNKQAPPQEFATSSAALPTQQKRKADGYVPRSGGKKLKLGPDGKKVRKAPAAAAKPAAKGKGKAKDEDALSVLLLRGSRRAREGRRRRPALPPDRPSRSQLLASECSLTCAPFLACLLLATTSRASAATRATTSPTRTNSAWPEGACLLPWRCSPSFPASPRRAHRRTRGAAADAFPLPSPLCAPARVVSVTRACPCVSFLTAPSKASAPLLTCAAAFPPSSARRRARSSSPTRRTSLTSVSSPLLSALFSLPR